MKRREFLQQAGAAALAAPALGPALAGDAGRRRPSILLAIADDWSWPHAGAGGDPVVRTPAFDRLAREGVLFTHAYCASPSCTPSRGTILTGQMFYRLEEGANLHGTLPAKFAVYPDLLEAAGYRVACQGKGWGPGRLEPGGRTRNPAGPPARSFEQFLTGVGADEPFCFWFGSHDPHRPYEKGSGLKVGKRLEDVRVPPFLPDTPEVRSDLLDYYLEVERFDRDVGRMVAALEAAGRLDDTIVLMTSDNGLPFPRGKTNLYDSGVRMPLAVRWGARAKGGRTVEDFIGFHDLAPTLLEAAGLPVPQAMTGLSFVDILLGGKEGRVDGRRDRVVVGRERHHAAARPERLGYPARAMRTHDYLYIRNFAPERGPAGVPGSETWPGDDTVGGFADIDGSPTKAVMWQQRADPKRAPLWALATAPRPAEELYDLRADPHQLTNVAGRPEYAGTQKKLADALAAYLAQTKDPRAADAGDAFDRYPYYGAVGKGG